MKTNILVLLLFSVLVQSCTFSALSANWKTAPTQEELLQRVTALEKQLSQQKRSSVFNNVTGAFKFTVDKIDKIVSKKAFIAAMLIAGPTFAFYCKFLDPTLIKRMIQFFTRSGDEAAVSVGGSMSSGIMQGIINNPVDFIKISVLLSLNNAVFYGIPYLLKIYADNNLFVKAATIVATTIA